MEYLPGRTLNQHIRKINPNKEEGHDEKIKSILK
jgi:hypothetical protein